MVIYSTNVILSQGCNRVVKSERQFIVQKRGGRQSRKTGAPLIKDSAMHSQVATKGEEEEESQKRLVKSQMKILEPLHLLDKSRDAFCIK